MTNKNLLSCFIAVYTILMGFSVPLQASSWHVQQGLASWYGQGFNGRPTASGEIFSEKEMTAAHRKLPLGTKVMVENLDTGDRIELKINDRGPYVDTTRRIIDLSRAAADRIGMVERGVGPVRVIVTEPAPQPQDSLEGAVFEVQVGAFVEWEEAQGMVEQLQEPYPQVSIKPREGPFGRYYRVRLGPFETEKQAKRVAKTLKRQGHIVFIDAVLELADSSYAQGENTLRAP